MQNNGQTPLPLETLDWKKKAENFLQDNIFYFIVFAMSVGYMLLGIVDIVAKDKTILEILADSTMSLTMGVTIGKLLGLQGILKGEKSGCYVKAREEHEKLCCSINGKIDRLDEFCQEKTAEKLADLQTIILSREGLSYKKFIEGDYIPRLLKVDKNKKKYKAYKKAKHLRITPLTTAGLIGNDTPVDDPFYLGETKTQRIRRENRKAWLSKVLLSIVFGYFGVQLVKNISYATLIWTAVQIIIFVAGGFGRYWNFYYFMYEEMPTRYKKQDNHLKIFEKWYAEKGYKENENV